MRWENLSINGTSGKGADGTAAGGGSNGTAPDGEPALPIPIAGAVARTFDTPEFRGMTFYEVRAKSIINRVPGTSRVPFEWTLNPYRGCSHACAYCLTGDTPVLMADGRTKPIADLKVGDRIYGTVQEGDYRRYVPTEVLAHWSTVKPAYRLTLEDGTRLVTSGDHRFLTERGWTFVTGGHQGAARRPHLTTGNKLMGTGQFAPPPKDSPEYRRGYLCGMIRGAGHVGPYTYAEERVHRFRLALDREALDRARDYLADFHVPTAEFVFQQATGSRQDASAIRASGQPAVATLRKLIRWPEQPDDDWRLGFLAGIFDAEGGNSGRVLRITDTDPDMLRWTLGCLRHFGFDPVLERTNHANGLCHVRVRGGLSEHLRFFHSVDPAITRKRTIDGTAIKSKAKLGVVSIESLELDLPLYDITTGTGDFIANGVVSHNCFARHTHTYLDLDAGHDFDTRVVVKVNAGELLRRELASPRWRGEQIAMGSNVDCYQRAEGRYRLMRDILAALRDFANPFSILTKGTLILRDLDLLKQAAEVTGVGLSMSVGFVDEALWRSVEPGAPSPRRRLDVVRRLSDEGFAVGVLMAPILPGISDTAESIDETVDAIAAAGAASVVPLGLHLRPGAREWYLAWLARERPDLLPRYREWYRDGAYLGQGYQRELTARVRQAARRYGLRSGGTNTARQVLASPQEVRVLGAGARGAGPVGGGPAGGGPAGGGPEAEQLTLL
ncbi:intein-containing Rv2578c family radical SAM protein [Planosporangium sp. 12N6]|uniref:intein-containing Rv2578c family radical SAM protein n=1 Tax=Planosporangium spinosum TaxID=3402278 RepID=UPI003CFA322E